MNIAGIMFYLTFSLATFYPKHGTYYRDVTNFVGFEIGTTAVVMGAPIAIREKNYGVGCLSLLGLGVMTYTTIDEIKVIKHRKQGLYLK